MLRTRISTAAVAATGTLLLAVSSASAAITVTADPDYPTGATVFTADPLLNSPAGRGVAADRQLRQTFQLDVPLTVENIVLSQVVGSGGVNGGYLVDFYAVDDVNASSIDFSTLTPLHSFSFLDTLPTTDARLGFTFTGDDQFVLPARSSGTEGYAIEISNADNATTVGNIQHSNSGTDVYTAGKFFTESGGQSGSSGDRDIGLAISGTVVPEPASLSMLGLGALALLRRRK